jgi:3-methyladenine DNA glycosylase Mpg
VIDAPEIPKKDIVVSKRVGISKAVDEPLRFYIKDNKFVSRK